MLPNKSIQPLLIYIFIPILKTFDYKNKQKYTNVCYFHFSVKPDIRPIPDNGIIVAEEHDSVTLACEVTHGFPTPEVTW